MKVNFPFIIAGGGPTGLFLGCLLAQKNIPFIILEAKDAPSKHSRSIGIHPPSLHLFSKTGLLDDFLHEGNKVDTGIACIGNRKVGEIHFSELVHPFPFILTLSQSITERLLEEKLRILAPQALIRNCAVTDFSMHKDYVSVETSQGKTYTGHWLVGCDGKESIIRKKAKIAFNGELYPDTYMMGDFEDTFAKRNEAVVHLCKDGLIESFPHGKNVRRWVVKTRRYIEHPTLDELLGEIEQRLCTKPDELTNSMLSSFRVQRMLADTFVKDRVILAGDAAHVVSPIGGQGMNLGWLDAFELAQHAENLSQEILAEWETSRRKSAEIAAKRAAFNMRMGRSFKSETFRGLLVKTLLSKPIRKFLMKQFTMDGL